MTTCSDTLNPPLQDKVPTESPVSPICRASLGKSHKHTVAYHFAELILSGVLLLSLQDWILSVLKCL